MEILKIEELYGILSGGPLQGPSGFSKSALRIIKDLLEKTDIPTRMCSVPIAGLKLLVHEEVEKSIVRHVFSIELLCLIQHLSNFLLTRLLNNLESFGEHSTPTDAPSGPSNSTFRFRCKCRGDIELDGQSRGVNCNFKVLKLFSTCILFAWGIDTNHLLAATYPPNTYYLQPSE